MFKYTEEERKELKAYYDGLKKQAAKNMKLFNKVIKSKEKK